MAREQLVVRPRLGTGSRVSSRLREQGLIPAVVYGKHIPNMQQSLVVDVKALRKLLQKVSANALIQLVIENEDGQQTETAMIREVQSDPITQELLHVDFFQADLDTPLVATVPINLVGSPEGVKQGGVLQHTLRELEVRCRPADIPEVVDVDVTNLKIGESVLVGDLAVADNVEIITSAETPIASVIAPTLEAEVEGEEAEEGETVEEEAPPEE